ncbi:fatty acyl-AMP ligase [Saccharopolyspora indica]|uniref:fatty acyl-AMP ligase n=1 Tax=Saccharopolyspora indica TaxID=1229659 RepID=UPI0022EB2538|nr:fatty acyl-AMP ligase [Saccharopolyspora indica]MDA3644268.1 fatty acyl-AMP ligase [Saccharopolyspora indica]
MNSVTAARLPAAAAQIPPPDALLPDQLAGWAAFDGEAEAVTFLDYRERPAGRRVAVTWGQLDDRATAVAGWLQSRVERGEPVAIMVDQTPDYLSAFLGVLRAGAVAVPLFGPDLPGHGDRLAAVLADCRPAIALTSPGKADAVAEFLDGHGLSGVEVACVPTTADREFAPVPLRPDDLAYLQYTSGSTGTPRGVMITHGNVVANASQACAAYGVTRNRGVTVSWLPLFHDMGLVLSIAAPLVAGVRTVLMQPVSFLVRPQRWLEALSANPGSISAAPSFAYAFSAARVAEQDKLRLRLDAVHALIDGSEPVQPASVDRFRAAFEACGLRPQVHRPSYGLAEATVFVSAGVADGPPRRRSFDRRELAAGRLVERSGTEAIEIVSCGQSIGQRVMTVDPGTACEVPKGTVGEIWVSGPNVGRGYWNRPRETDEVFGARLADRPELGSWLRTGDLGAWHGGELYVTGRLKDLIIVDGRNHYPQDVEQTVEEAHRAIGPRKSVAFAVGTPDGERAVVLAERSRKLPAGEVDPAELAGAVRAAVAQRHGLTLHDVQLVEPGTLQRTSSGKIARSACRARYLEARP